jgi:putative membrane protein
MMYSNGMVLVCCWYKSKPNLNMKSISTLKALLVVGLFVTACDPSQKRDDSADQAMETNDQVLDNRDDEKDADFVVNAMAASYAEVEIAKLAQERSADQEVISIAKKLETDHSAIIGELQSLANEKGIEVPSAETNEQREARNKLAEKDPSNFDKELCEVLMDNHKDAVDDFEKRADKTEDPELKSWISRTLPTLRSHLEMIKDHEKNVKEG